jgi:hypothetical protein
MSAALAAHGAYDGCLWEAAADGTLPSVAEVPVEDGLLAPCSVVSLADHTTRH